MPRFPALFVSHGPPTMAVDDSPARRFLAGCGAALGRPEAIVVASAHWETAAPRVGASPAPDTVHDFFGFPEPLYRIRYPAPGSAELADRTVGLLRDAGLPAEADPEHGLDHGAWVPLMLLYPEADIPVVPVAVQPDADPEHHRRLGAALAPLRDDGVLLLTSGNLTHNLAGFRAHAADAEAPGWVRGFTEWLADAVAEDRRDDLVDYRRRAPHAVDNHPTDEHFLPFFVALGAASDGVPGRRLHHSYSHAVLAMDAYAFD